MFKQNKALILWLTVVCSTVFLMIVVGGVTRLTESGLSMVEWRPLIGIIPPIGELAWQQVFEAYKSYPQYQKVNVAMDLEAFKGIFYWEYGHRVLGRLIGIIFFVPFVILLVMGKVPKKLVPKLWLGLALGGLQGLMGWYMVMSGLVDIPRVSHFRLAAHLVLALIILAYLFWLILDLWQIKRIEILPRGFRKLCYAILAVLGLQILYGAFVAGNRAGYGFNTFPLMNGELMPDLVWQLSPVLMNLVDNNVMLQFVHRWLGALLLALTSVLLWSGWRSGEPSLRTMVSLVALVLSAQFLLGVFTLIKVVPIGLASLHQAGACLLLLVVLMLVYMISHPKVKT